jgi:mono/diheme cytochrome c family protein/glucose/arabinose dehydrogenase
MSWGRLFSYVGEAYAVAMLAALFFVDSIAAGELRDEDDAEQGAPHRPGLIAEFRQVEKRFLRIDETVQFDWEEDRPDYRVDTGPFEAVWKGVLFVGPPGEHRFDLWLCGAAAVRIDGRTVVEGASDESSRLVEGPPVPLDFGYRTIEIEFHKTTNRAAIKVLWSSHSFEREPIPAARLMHVADPEAETHVRGEELVVRGRCASCHDLGLSAPPAPDLRRLAGTISRSWLTEHLQSAPRSPHSHAPDFGLTRRESESIVAFLIQNSERARLPQRSASDARRGRELVERIGCLACHRINGAGVDGAASNVDLSNIASKRPPGFFQVWLRTPAALNSSHSMPTFDLENEELDAIATYLQSLGEWDPADGSTDVDEAEVAEGRGLFERFRCVQCHKSPGVFEPAILTEVRWNGDSGCLGDPKPERGQPGYRMCDGDARATRLHLSTLVRSPAPSRDRYESALFSRSNCRGCHSRGASEGLRSVVASFGARDPKQQSALVPPTLESVGAKLKPEWLALAVAGEAPRLRPWLAPRMPRFPFSLEDKRALVHFLQVRDGVPARSGEAPPFSVQERILAAHRLVGSAGFGCMSCHKLGPHEPTNVELAAFGPDLRNLHERMDFEWFRRWIRNPSRIAPGVEMPAVNLAAPGLLDGRIETQLRALWDGLNAESFNVPSQNSVQSLTAIGRERPIVFRDVFEHADKDRTTRSFAVGFSNGHNLLIDLDRFAVRRWWFGDFAHQYTRGKTWYWQSAGTTLFDQPAAPALFALVRKGALEQPRPSGQAVAWIREWARDPHSERIAAEFQVRLSDDRSLDVQLTLEPIPEGVLLSVRLSGLPEDAEAVVSQTPAKALRTPLGGARIAPPSNDADSKKGFPREFQLQLALEGPLAPVSAVKPASPYSPPRRVLPVLPGYEVVRLPVPDGPMPTAMAFRRDGALVVTSLKGGVFLARDANGDGDLDSYSPYFDHLAAPFGVLMEGSNPLVVHKHELLRLFDEDEDDYCERAEVVSTGWGVTFDYHDWAVGPVPDGEGGYFLALSCQQDRRSEAEALGRGKLIRTLPDARFEVFCHGLRFPMGLVRNGAGDVFATDNQGGANTFNELNHLRAGKHYGFFNQLETPKPETSLEAPAVQIPHPWTGSVNGIAFIPGGGEFGPYAGQLIGAEYTTRRLVRISLQAVGDTYQGCVYPFGEPDARAVENDQTFLGPIALAFAPSGDLYVGGMIDSGWGGGNNRGAIERVRRVGDVPLGIREVRAWSGGFDVDFTGQVDRRLAAAPAAYAVASFRRIHAGGYATPDRDRAPANVREATVSPEGDSVRLRVEPMRPGFVYEISVKLVGADQGPMVPAVAFYTLHTIP